MGARDTPRLLTDKPRAARVTARHARRRHYLQKIRYFCDNTENPYFRAMALTHSAWHWAASRDTFLAAPEDQQSEFGDGYGARFVGLLGLPEIGADFWQPLKTNKASLVMGSGLALLVFRAARA